MNRRREGVRNLALFGLAALVSALALSAGDLIGSESPGAFAASYGEKLQACAGLYGIVWAWIAFARPWFVSRLDGIGGGFEKVAPPPDA